LNGTKQIPTPGTLLSVLSILALVAAAPSAAHAEATMAAGPSEAAGNNMLWNGTFVTASLLPWRMAFDSPRNGQAAADKGELCVKIDDPGKQRFDVVLRQRPLAVAKGHKYQLRFKTRATAPTKLRPRISKISVPFTELWAATVDADATPRTYSAAFDGSIEV
jgi:hypothetical protein